MIVDRLGARSFPEKTDAVAQLSRPMTVEDVRVLLGISGYLQKFVPNYSTAAAPISDLLRDPRFRTKKTRKKRMPGGKKRKRLSMLCANFSHRRPSLLFPLERTFPATY